MVRTKQSLTKKKAKSAYSHKEYSFTLHTLPPDIIVKATILKFGSIKDLHLELIDKQARKQVGDILVKYWSMADRLALADEFHIDKERAVKEKATDPKWKYGKDNKNYTRYFIEAMNTKGRNFIVKATLQVKLVDWFEKNVEFMR